MYHVTMTEKTLMQELRLHATWDHPEFIPVLQIVLLMAVCIFIFPTKIRMLQVCMSVVTPNEC